MSSFAGGLVCSLIAFQLLFNCASDAVVTHLMSSLTGGLDCFLIALQLLLDRCSIAVQWLF
jgi:hypothetical protein